MPTFSAPLSVEEGMAFPSDSLLLPAMATGLTLDITPPQTPCLAFKTIRGLSLLVSFPSSAFITSFLCQLYCQELQSHAGIQQSFHPCGAGTQACSNSIWRQRLSWLQQKIKHPQLTGSEHNLGVRKGGSEGSGESTIPYSISKAASLGENIHIIFFSCKIIFI